LVATDEGPAFGDELFVVRAAMPLVGTIEISAQKRKRLGHMPQSFLSWLTFSMLVFSRDLSSPVTGHVGTPQRKLGITFAESVAGAFGEASYFGHDAS
jgi:hypothetical protein